MKDTILRPVSRIGAYLYLFASLAMQIAGVEIRVQWLMLGVLLALSVALTVRESP